MLKYIAIIWEQMSKYGTTSKMLKTTHFLNMIIKLVKGLITLDKFQSDFAVFFAKRCQLSRVTCAYR